MRNILILFLYFFSIQLICQETENNKEIDSLYREDQFFIALNYTSLVNQSFLSENKIPLGFNAGFLRDFPLNSKRNFAIAPGFGYSFKNYNHELLISEVNNQIRYTNINGIINPSKNYFRLQYIDFPLEIRWRTSTAESHKFWRVYTGFKLSYLVKSKSFYKDEVVTSKIVNNPDFNKLNYSAYLSLGWNTWNIHVNYGLLPLFNNPSNSDLSNVHYLDIGLIFYIL